VKKRKIKISVGVPISSRVFKNVEEFLEHNPELKPSYALTYRRKFSSEEAFRRANDRAIVRASVRNDAEAVTTGEGSQSGGPNDGREQRRSEAKSVKGSTTVEKESGSEEPFCSRLPYSPALELA